jgi:hypothetical protein
MTRFKAEGWRVQGKPFPFITKASLNHRTLSSYVFMPGGTPRYMKINMVFKFRNPQSKI